MAKSLEVLGNTNKTEVTKKIETGLPKTSYVGKKVPNIFQELIQKVGKIKKLKPISISSLEQANIVNA